MKKVAPYGITPPCRAMPLRIAPIPCSRTPKGRFLPPGAGRRGGSRGNLPPPLLLRLLPARQRLPEMGEHVVGHEEGRCGGPSEVFLREGDLGLPQRRPVRAGRVLLVRASVADARPHDHERGALALGGSGCDRRRRSP